MTHRHRAMAHVGHIDICQCDDINQARRINVEGVLKGEWVVGSFTKVFPHKRKSGIVRGHLRRK
jgi:hypothetical protein